MTEVDSQRTCPDCNKPLVEIKLFARSMVNPLSGAASDSDFLFTDVGAERSFWECTYEEKGIVKSYRCQSCGRILIYGDEA